MDKRAATLTLTEKLRDNNNYHVIINPYYQKKILEESIACYQIGEIIAFGSYAIRDSLKNKNSVLYEKLEPKANYLFIESFEIDKRATASSFAIIGGEEINQLRKLFYKNVHLEIAYAMKFLGIKNFIDFYATYTDKSHDNSPIKILKEEDSIMKEDLEVAKKFIDTALKLKYDSDAEVNKDVFRKNLEDFKSLNVRFERIGIKTRIESHDAAYSGYVTRATLLKLVGELSSAIKDIKSKCKDALWNEFVDFVFFYLPVGEQDIESNKYILKNSSNLDFVAAVLSKEYSEGKHFREYFDVLDKEAQDKVVESLKVFSGRKPVYDSFLWSKGFKNVNLDYSVFYRENTEGFIEYFNKRNFEEKKTILKDIMSSDFINEDVVKWLNEHEAELIREVGLNG